MSLLPRVTDHLLVCKGQQRASQNTVQLRPQRDEDCVRGRKKEKGFSLDQKEMVMVQVIRLNHQQLLLREGQGHSHPQYLRREDHAGLAELYLQCPQVCPAHGGALHG